MRWPPFQHIFFDCDSTLTSVEGIDILAETAGKQWRVEVLTQAAMDGELDLEDVYAKRLKAVKPTKKQVGEIRQVYKQHAVEDAVEIIQSLQLLGHEVYIISGGLAEPVREFGIYLGVPEDHIRAVGLEYNALAGNRWWENNPESNSTARYLDYEEGALTISDGKADIVRELLGDKPGRALLIGDGNSDLLAGRAVDLFVGYGGVVARERVQQEAPCFVSSLSLAPLLALVLGPAGLNQLDNTPYRALSRKAKTLISQGAIQFNDEQLKLKFDAALRAAH